MPRTTRGPALLGRDECLALLRRGTLGRVALSAAALPVVVPVPYALTDAGIVIRLGDDPSIDEALVDSVVAFSVDDIDPVNHTGWSVLVTGVAREAVLDGAACVVVPVDVISGRRLGG
jgi:nitroimidazol reductase NimA-like FMN-containing flavoprotein (pyridoxamine 5'-phosphate oxidase superfamily)